MQWRWKAERFPLNRNQIEVVRDQLSNELFEPEDDGRVIKDDEKSSSSSSNEDDESGEEEKNPKNRSEKRR